MPPPPRAGPAEGPLTSFSSAPAGGFCSTSLPRGRFSSVPDPWGFTLGFPQPWMTWGRPQGSLRGTRPRLDTPPLPTAPPARTLAVSVSRLSWKASMASASHKCTLPMTLSAPYGPQNLSVMSTMESGTGVSTRSSLHTGPPRVHPHELMCRCVDAPLAHGVPAMRVCPCTGGPMSHRRWCVCLWVRHASHTCGHCVLS